MHDVLNKNDLTGEELLTALKSINDFNEIYRCQIRHYTLEQHTLLVIGEYKNYFSTVPLPIKDNLFLLMLGLHDIGKPKAFLEGNKNKQYEHTVKIINSIRGLLPFNTAELDICIALLKADSIGMYMQDQLSLKDAKNQIEQLSRQTCLNIFEFFKLMVIYYQCDTASYTMDAGGFPFLEHLYLYQNNKKIFSYENMRLNFSASYENKYIKLEKALFE